MRWAPELTAFGFVDDLEDLPSLEMVLMLSLDFGRARDRTEGDF